MYTIQQQTWRLSMGIQDITDVTTEAVTLEDVSAAAEKIKDTNPGVIRQWLESL